MRVRVLICGMLVCYLGAALAQENKCPGSSGSTDCNGISVGAPKVFDNRALTIMLDTLTQQLKQQNNFIDQKSLMTALANLQGLSTSETSTNVSITGNPTPARDVSSEFNAGNVDANGNRLPNTFDRKTDTNQASVTPQAPGLDTQPGLPSGFSPMFANSAGDLLNDQVNLTYQIFNLQMILDRALSDRLTEDGQTRAQAILGFNVTIDPPRRANDAVAVVEIKLHPEEQSEPGNLSLVALMPQEKTYNAAALSTKSNAFSGAAAVNVLQFGASARKRSQTFYVYRDTDTLSYERMTPEGDLVFGWMFRPVLGRRSVSPGLRQMFAVVGLPEVDGANHKFNFSSKVRTYWKKYDRSTMTSFTAADANRAKRYWYGLSFGQARPELFSQDGFENGKTYSELTVFSTDHYQTQLAPVVDSVEWRPAGAKNVIVSAKGNNFFISTQVALGDKIYATPADGLLLKSNQAFDIATTIDQLVNGPGAIVGRYGISTPLILNGSPNGPLDPCGVEIESATNTHSIAGYLGMNITLQSRKCGQDTPERTSAVHVASQAVREAQARLDEEKPKDRSVAELQKLHVPYDGDAVKRFQADLDAKQAHLERVEHNLRISYLPKMRISQSSTSFQTPIVSVNGSAIELPYDVYEPPHVEIPGEIERVVVHVSFKDSLLSSGGATVKVSWPFYNTDKWTATFRYNAPALGFEVTRASDKRVVISRINGLAFVNDPKNHFISPEDTGDHCWRLIAGDSDVLLPTSTCKPPKSEPAQPKKGALKRSSSKDDGKPTNSITNLPNTVSATVDKMSSHAVLLAPDGTAYHIDIPDLTDKKDPGPKPIEMKQGDSTWISITLPVGKKASAVEANGKDLKWRIDNSKEDESKAAADKRPQIINVEITRDLTAKSGTLDLNVLDAKGKPIADAAKKINITCAPCIDKGDK